MNSKGNKSTNLIYQLKISLLHIKPAIYRIIQIKGNATFADLHYCIQTAMGWDDMHLHNFKIKGNIYQNCEINDYMSEFDDLDESQYQINELVKKSDKFTYTYDFGDDWMHQITVQKIVEPENDIHYPICTKGQGACPPEDCGGTWRYENMLEVIKNPDNDEYEDIIEWLGEEFDSMDFNINGVNSHLKNL